jgi:hypothetical protein
VAAPQKPAAAARLNRGDALLRAVEIERMLEAQFNFLSLQWLVRTGKRDHGLAFIVPVHVMLLAKVPHQHDIPA